MTTLSHKDTMSSREIARIAGRTHSHLLRDIREMEKAWEKITQTKFGFSEYKDSTGRKLPEYQLNKYECLYIATKFNDEARAKLVLRWAELEEKEQKHTLKIPAPKTYNGVKCIHYTSWLVQNGYSLMSGQVRERIRKYPQQFRKTKDGWYMSEAIAKYYLNFKNPQQKIAELPSINPELAPMFTPEQVQEMTILIQKP